MIDGDGDDEEGGVRGNVPTSYPLCGVCLPIQPQKTLA